METADEIEYRYNIDKDWDDVVLQDGQVFAGIRKQNGLLFCKSLYGLQKCLGNVGCLCVSGGRAVMVQ